MLTSYKRFPPESEKTTQPMYKPSFLKWVNKEWKQVEADRHKLQNTREMASFGGLSIGLRGGRYKKPMAKPVAKPMENLSDGRTESVGWMDGICRTDGHIQTPLKKHCTLEKLFYLCSDRPPNYFITTNLARGFQKWA